MPADWQSASRRPHLRGLRLDLARTRERAVDLSHCGRYSDGVGRSSELQGAKSALELMEALESMQTLESGGAEDECWRWWSN